MTHITNKFSVFSNTNFTEKPYSLAGFELSSSEYKMTTLTISPSHRPNNDNGFYLPQFILSLEGDAEGGLGLVQLAHDLLSLEIDFLQKMFQFRDCLATSQTLFAFKL